MKYQVTKTYPASLGLSCCFRQWRAIHSHCQYLHGYAIEVEIIFESDTLDDRNWVIDFGGLKELKQWLVDTFDHKTIIALDDPEFNTFLDLKNKGVIDLLIVENVGCERFAEMVADKAVKLYGSIVKSVEVREHQGNSAVVVI